MKNTLFVLTLCLLVACSKEKDNIFVMVIASKMVKAVEPTGNVERDYFLAKWDRYVEWTLFDSRIHGFEYKEGYEYLLLVREKPLKNPPMDHYGAYYYLIDILSITEIESDIPPYYFHIINRIITR